MSSISNGITQVRLLGGGDTLHGFADIMRHDSFDLSLQLKMNDDDNIQNGTGGPFNILSVQTQMLEYSFEATVASVAKFYTIRNYFSDSIPSQSTHSKF